MARDAIIHRVKPYLLHGEQYYEIHYSYTNEPDTLRQSRTAHDYIYPSKRVTTSSSRPSSTSSPRSRRRDD